MYKIKLVYFDIGNVLLDYSCAFFTAAKEFERERRDFLKIHYAVSNDMYIGKVTPQDFWGLCRNKLSIDPENSYDILDSWTNDYFSLQTVHNLVLQLQNGGYKIGLLSNLFSDMLPYLLNKNIIPNINYEQIIISCDVKTKKPEEKIYEIAQEQSGLRAEEIMLIDDKRENMLTAKQLNWKCITFDYYHVERSVDEIQKVLSLN